jgi:hypothetical protein
MVQNASVNFPQNSNKKKMDNKSSTSSRSPEDVEGEPVAKKSRLVLKTIIYDESIPNQWLDEPPLEVWDHHIIPLLGLRDLALSRPVCTFFEAYWQDKFSNNVLPLRVGNDVATINEVMGVVEILSSRREYTKSNPFVVLLGKGEHEINSSYEDPYDNFGRNNEEYEQVFTTRPLTLSITCSSITFFGQGKEETIIKGGFAIEEQQNIMFKQMTVTNPSDSGMYIHNAEVELNDVVVKNCDRYALNVKGSINSTLVARRCEFKECQGGLASYRNTISQFHDCTFHTHKVYGLFVHESIVHLHGEATVIHTNAQHGIAAWNSAKVLIHLPSHHNTIYNNTRGDRLTHGGTITNVED